MVNISVWSEKKNMLFISIQYIRRGLSNNRYEMQLIVVDALQTYNFLCIRETLNQPTIYIPLKPWPLFTTIHSRRSDTRGNCSQSDHDATKCICFTRVKL